MSDDDDKPYKTAMDEEAMKACMTPDGAVDMQKLRKRDDVDCVPIYGGPVDYRPPPGSVYIPSEPSSIERSVERQIAEELPCKYCEELPIGIDSDGKVEAGCCEGCPHEGADMYPHAWIRANRRDRDEG